MVILQAFTSSTNYHLTRTSMSIRTEIFIMEEELASGTSIMTALLISFSRLTCQVISSTLTKVTSSLKTSRRKPVLPVRNHGQPGYQWPMLMETVGWISIYAVPERLRVTGTNTMNFSSTTEI